MIRRPPRSTPLYSSAASDVYKRQPLPAHQYPPHSRSRPAPTAPPHPATRRTPPYPAPRSPPGCGASGPPGSPPPPSSSLPYLTPQPGCASPVPQSCSPPGPQAPLSCVPTPRSRRPYPYAQWVIPPDASPAEEPGSSSIPRVQDCSRGSLQERQNGGTDRPPPLLAHSGDLRRCIRQATLLLADSG